MAPSKKSDRKSNKIRVGIIGTGIGNAHYNGYTKCDDVEVIGVRRGPREC